MSEAGTRRRALVLGASIAVAGLTAFAAVPWLSPTASAEDPDGVIVGIDMDPSGNTATGLGTIDRCIAVSSEDVIDIDVWIDDIEAGPGSWLQPDECIAEFYYDLGGWPASRSDGTAPQITTRNFNLFLGAASGSGPSDSQAEAVPDGDDPYRADIGDFGTAECVTEGHTEGVLARYTLDTTGAASAVYELTLASVFISRGAPPGGSLIIQDVWDSSHSPKYGLLAVDAACLAEAVSVGGIAEYPDVALGQVEPADSPAEGPGSSPRNYIPLAAGVAAALGALTAGAWWARRRSLG